MTAFSHKRCKHAFYGAEPYQKVVILQIILACCVYLS